MARLSRHQGAARNYAPAHRIIVHRWDVRAPLPTRWSTGSRRSYQLAPIRVGFQFRKVWVRSGSAAISSRSARGTDAVAPAHRLVGTQLDPARPGDVSVGGGLVDAVTISERIAGSLRVRSRSAAAPPGKRRSTGTVGRRPTHPCPPPAAPPRVGRRVGTASAAAVSRSRHRSRRSPCCSQRCGFSAEPGNPERRRSPGHRHGRPRSAAPLPPGLDHAAACRSRRRRRRGLVRRSCWALGSTRWPWWRGR